MRTQITRRVIFHAGHMLKDDDSKCYHPHGHEYIFECTVEGGVQEEGTEAGMIMNFGQLKTLMMTHVHDVLDHRFIIDTADPRRVKFLEAVGNYGVVVFRFAPTAENLAKWCYETIQIYLPNEITIVKVKIQETLNCYAEYYG